MYPVLMAADILMFNANKVPVGRDQVQHIEMARDIGQRFNHIYGGEYFTLPEAAIEENVATLPGLDGRKMSKSYNNTIPLWLPEKELRKAILGIVTNSQAPGEPKNPDESHIFSIYQAFASAEETAVMRRRSPKESVGVMRNKKYTSASILNWHRCVSAMRRSSLSLAKSRTHLLAGATKARSLALPLIARLRSAIGLRSLRAQITGMTQKNRKQSAREKVRCSPWCSATEDEAFSHSRSLTRRKMYCQQSGFADAKAAMVLPRIVSHGCIGATVAL